MGAFRPTAILPKIPLPSATEVARTLVPPSVATTRRPVLPSSSNSAVLSACVFCGTNDGVVAPCSCVVSFLNGSTDSSGSCSSNFESSFTGSSLTDSSNSLSSCRSCNSDDVANDDDVAREADSRREGDDSSSGSSCSKTGCDRDSSSRNNSDRRSSRGRTRTSFDSFTNFHVDSGSSFREGSCCDSDDSGSTFSDREGSSSSLN